MTRKKNEMVAAISSMLVTGLGQLYNGQVVKGMLYFIVFLLIPIWWLIGIADTYITACNSNGGDLRDKFIHFG